MRVALHRDGRPVEGFVLRRIVSAHEAQETWPSGLKGQDDETWSWPKIVDEHSGEAWTHFELQAGGRAQGLMIVKHEHELRAPGNTGRVGCYLEYVAAAPWNRKDSGDKRFERHTPVGLVMIGLAIIRSQELGHDGRLAWHSKPNAEKWYRNELPGHWSGGPDVSEDNFEYFELTAIAARAFLTKHRSLFVEAES